VKARRAAALIGSLAGARIPLREWWSSSVVAREAIDRGALQKLTEFAPLVALVRSRRPERVVEIGSAQGGTLWAWCQVAADDAALISVDLPSGPFGGDDVDTRAWLAFPRDRQNLELVRGDSHSDSTLDRTQAALDGPPDFVFIDGDHTLEGVRRDFQMYGTLVPPGGMIAFHDVMPNPGLPDHFVGDVHLFWPEVKKNFRHLEILDAADTSRWGGRWGGIGILFP
jgi:predicted O-methyltransferase YrrM